MRSHLRVLGIAALALAVAGTCLADAARAQWRRADYGSYYALPAPYSAPPAVTTRQQITAQLAWQNLPPLEISCLGRHLRQQGSSIRALISRGVLPSDRRLLQLRSSCGVQITQTAQRSVQPRPSLVDLPQTGVQARPDAVDPHTVAPPQTAAQPIASLDLPPQGTEDSPQRNTAQPAAFVVDGVGLGSRVPPDSELYKQYRCIASDKFPGFTECRREERKTQNGNEVVSYNTMLRSQDGAVSYIKSYVAPALFGKDDVQNELAKLSARFGETPRTFEMPKRDGLPDAIIAIWGKIRLEPLDTSDMSAVASGGPHTGLLVSFIGDLPRSAKAQVPIYRMAGGPGYLWAASFDREGRGVLQLLAIDASQIAAPDAAPPGDSAPPANTRKEADNSILLPLESEGGTYKVPVLINKAVSLKFVVDSGASDVTIPADIVMTLLETGALHESDFIGVQTYRLADGSTVPSARFRIRSLTVGDTVVENVTGGITPLSGSLLLGQSFLGRFKSWSMDNDKRALVLKR